VARRLRQGCLALWMLEVGWTPLPVRSAVSGGCAVSPASTVQASKRTSFELVRPIAYEPSKVHMDGIEITATVITRKMMPAA